MKWSFLFAWLLVVFPGPFVLSQIRRAIVTIRSNGTNDASGLVEFSQEGHSAADITVTVNISGLAPGSTHGFHVHQFGDTSNFHSSPPSTGFHFAPVCPPEENCTLDQTHGKPPDLVRHAGDMGNINVNSNGEVSTTFVIGQGKMSLNDTLRSIVGRSLVVHANEDTFAQPYGNAGAVVAAGVVGIQQSSDASVSPALPVDTVLCLLRDTGVNADNDIRSYLMIDFTDKRVDPIVRSKTNLTSPMRRRATKMAIFENGDLTDIPTSLGATFQSPLVDAVVLDNATVCGDTWFHLASVPSLNLIDLAGRGCGLVVQDEVVASGVIGVPSADVFNLFGDEFFENDGRCEAGGESDDGLSTGAMVGIGIGVGLGSICICCLIAYLCGCFGSSEPPPLPLEPPPGLRPAI